MNQENFLLLQMDCNSSVSLKKVSSPAIEMEKVAGLKAIYIYVFSMSWEFVSFDLTIGCWFLSLHYCNIDTPILDVYD